MGLPELAKGTDEVSLRTGTIRESQLPVDGGRRLSFHVVETHDVCFLLVENPVEDVAEELACFLA
jgi:hypothetical protein